MIRLLLDPPRFECETATDAAALAKLMGIVVERIDAPRPVQARRALEIASPPDEDETARPIVHPQGRMAPTGHEKHCKTCGKSFPVLDRSDCPSVYCRACRPAPVHRKNPKAPIPAAGRSPRLPIGPEEPVTKCKTCGDKVRAFELINGQCLDCAPMSAVQGVG